MKTNDHYDDVPFLLQLTSYSSQQTYFRQQKHNEAKKVFGQWCNVSVPPQINLFDTIHAYFQKNYRGAEYHDWYHTCCMIVNCAAGYEYMAKDITANESERITMNSLLLAAAFHDIGHTGGREPDAVNVSIALTLCSEFMSLMKINTRGIARSSVDKQMVLDLIQVTQFPFKLEPTTIAQEIIRDSDLLQILEPTWYDVIYQNLFTEINRSREVSFKDFCSGQRDFLHAAKFYSNWWNEVKYAEFGGIGLERANDVWEKVGSPCSTSN